MGSCTLEEYRAPFYDMQRRKQRSENTQGNKLILPEVESSPEAAEEGKTSTEAGQSRNFCDNSRENIINEGPGVKTRRAAKAIFMTILTVYKTKIERFEDSKRWKEVKNRAEIVN